MRFLLIPLVALAGVALAVPAMAQQAGSDAASKTATQKKMCRPIVGTGTILPRTFCLTKAEWAEMAARNERDSETVRQRKFNSIEKFDRRNGFPPNP
ncbi:MAG: hypothetical protein V4564_13460 [Pseudomonadota bacterium]